MKKLIILLAFLGLAIKSQAQNFKYGKVSEAEVLETAHPVYRDADAAILFRSQKVYFEILRNFEFSVVTEVHERRKIYTTDGFDWATKEIVLYHKGNEKEEIEELEGVSYQLQNGKIVKVDLEKIGIFEEKMNEVNSKTSFKMPAVTEGSVIEYKYTIRSPFWSAIDKMELQESVPLNKVEISVAIPGFLGYEMHFNPKSPIVFELKNKVNKVTSNVVHAKTQRGTTTPINTTTLSYEENVFSIGKENIPPLEPEVFVDYLPSHAASLGMELQYIALPDTPLKNYALTWEGVAQSIFREGNYKEELSHSKLYEDDLKLLLKGIVGPEEKARAIYSFVKAKVKWNGYLGFVAEKGLRKAYKEGEGNVGDINVLLTSMLRAAGLEAYPVLVSTERNGIPLFPTRNGFNYVISSVQIQGELYLLDATEAYADFGELPARARNWRGRRISDQGRSDWVDLMPGKKSSKRTVINLTFGDDLALTGRTVNILDGLNAKSFRDRFAGMAEESYLQFLEKEKGNIEIKDLSVENERLIGSDVQESFNFNLKDALQQINGRIYFQPLLFEKMEENPFKAEQRTLPIFFEYPNENVTKVNIKIPDGYDVESVPENMGVTLGNGGGNYRFQVIQHGQYLRVESSLEWNELMYGPEEYANIKEFYKLIVAKNLEAVVLKKI